MKFVPLQQRLKTDIADSLKRDLKVTNVNALPHLKKVIINVGLSQKKYSSKDIQAFIAEQLAIITGQKAAVRKSRMSISNFNIRENMVVGMIVTLRGKQMYYFLDRLIRYVLPRIRDFRGVPAKMDGRGNYALGIVDQSIFPELPPPEANKIFGMQIQITTDAGTDERGMALLKHIGMPFRRPAPKKSADVA
jgi:large subunit ribosomal protein L5